MLDRSDPATDALVRATTGHYNVEREIGRGGMGVVYLGVDEQLERPVAIKTLPPHLAADPRVRSRFLREARTAGALSHPNIVPIYAAAERDGVVYFAMRYINGESLAERIARVGAMPAGEVVSILRQLASALGYAHTNGVVHRDIKAENVLLDSETGRAMLTDFGIARLAETHALTATGTVLGTVQYMSPEQVSGDELDGRSDLYSLGILAFLALSGRFPFERPTASAIVVAHVTSMPPKLCSLAMSVPAALGDIVDRLLSKSPGERYADGSALRAALDMLPVDNSVVIVPTHDSAPIARVPARNAPAPTMASPPASPPASLPASLTASSASTKLPQSVSDTSSNVEVMSSAEAQAVWARATELQANTGMIVPPSQFQLGKVALSSETVGFDAAIVRASAVDAGIDARYIDRALAERARAAALVRASDNNDAAITVSNAMLRKPNGFLGARTKIELETVFDGELSDEGYEDVAEEMRLALGEMVTVNHVGRTLTVTSAAVGGGKDGTTPRQVQITLTSRNGRTTVRAFENLTASATGMFVGIMAGGGIGGGMGVAGAVMGATHIGPLAVAAFIAANGVTYGIARMIFTRLSHKRERELREVVQRVIARARECLAPPGTQGKLPRR